jgi:hypothetical protein
VVSKSWTNEPGFLVKTTGRFEVEDFANHIRRFIAGVRDHMICVPEGSEFGAWVTEVVQENLHRRTQR